MKIEMGISGADEAIEALQKLPAEVGSKGGGPVRVALRKAAVVIQKPAVENLRAATARGNTSTGLLEKNVVVSRGKVSGIKGERYTVRVRKVGYPDRSEGAGKKSTGVTTYKTANLLEYGSSQQEAEPWLRPAFTAHARAAIDMATRELAPAIERAAKKYLKTSKK